MKMLFTILSAENGEKTHDGTIINLKLTHQEMADMAGLSRETVTRVLGQWQKDGSITIARNRHILLHPVFFRRE